MKILTDVEACRGCRMCELACSFHHKKAFSPEASSIKVSSDGTTGKVWLSIDSTCDYCQGEASPRCVGYCIYGALKEMGRSEHKRDQG